MVGNAQMDEGVTSTHQIQQTVKKDGDHIAAIRVNVRTLHDVKIPRKKKAWTQCNVLCKSQDQRFLRSSQVIKHA